MRVATLILASLVAACSAAPTFPPNTGAIVDQELINRASCGRLGAHGEGAWTPTETDIQQLEPVLLERLVPELARDTEIYEVQAPSPGDYIRRYAGVTVQGRRVIAICGEAASLYEERGEDWRTSYILFRDGGAMSFGAYYDRAKRTITYFEFGFVA